MKALPQASRATVRRQPPPAARKGRTQRPGKARAAGVLTFLLAALLGSWPAWAQSVALTGVLGSKALLVIDGTAPRTAAPGDTVQGVKLVSVTGDQAVVEIGGRRQTLRVGEAPVSVGGRAPSGDGAGRITLSAGSGGHFLGQGSINGRAAQFMVDTGATAVSMGVAEARRLGVNYEAGQPVRMNTANGVAQGWRVKLGSVRIGDVTVYEVDAVVTPESMPFVLLGNSYLNRFQMRRDNDLMVLEKRY